MFKVFSPRQIITNRTDVVDGSLDGVDPIVKSLRNQVSQLAYENAKLEEEHMNSLSLIQKDKDAELNLIKARIQVTEELNSSLKESKELLINKVADLENKVNLAQKALDEEKKRTQEIHKLNSSLKLANASLTEKITDLNLTVDKTKNSLGKTSRQSIPFVQDQVKKIEMFKSRLSISSESDKAMDSRIQQLYEKRKKIKDKFECGRSRSIERSRSSSNGSRRRSEMASIDPDEIKARYDKEVKRNSLLEEQIQVIVKREDTTNKHLAKTKQDAEDSLIQKNKTIYRLEEELNRSKDNIVRLEKKLKSIDKTNDDEGTAQITVSEIEQQKSECINLRKKLYEKEEEVKNLIAREKDKLEQKDTKIKHISKENKQNLEIIKEKEANFQLIIQKHQVKLLELDKMRERYDAEMERKAQENEKDEEGEENLNLRENALKFEQLLQNQGSEMEELKNKLISINTAEQENLQENIHMKKNYLKQEECLRNQSSKINELKSKLINANAAEQEKIREKEYLQKHTLEQEERLRNQGSEIDELKRKLTSTNIAKSEVEVNLKEVLHNTAKEEDNSYGEIDKLKGIVEKLGEKITALKRQIKEKDEDVKRTKYELAQMLEMIKEKNAVKTNEIQDLHGELCEKTALVTNRSIELEKIKFEVDEKKLRYESKVKSLQAEIKMPGDRDHEIDELRMRNSVLEYEIAESKQETRRIRGKLANMVTREESNCTVKILRNRNECLKNDVGILLSKMKDISRCQRTEVDIDISQRSEI